MRRFRSIESYLGRLKYDYLSKYFAELSFRRDGSSRFKPGNQWGNFWSLGGTWVLSKEDFIKDIDWIDNLKFRASYGQVGNDASVGYYGYYALYGSYQYAEKPAAYKTQNEAADIKWESANTFSTALEGRLLDKVNFSVEYFNKPALRRLPAYFGRRYQHLLCRECPDQEHRFRLQLRY